MNEENQNENTEISPVPDFTGEEMKMPENSGVTMEVREKSALSGPVIAILAILLVIVFGGLYKWFSTLNETPPTPIPAPIERPTPEENNEPESTTAEAQANNLDVVSTSDEIAAIEADIEATDLESLDAELEAIEAEFEASN